jgi:imidazolonepropionase-like amidohydrolase
VLRIFAVTIALRGATLIDGTGAPARANALLVIRDGRIASVGEATPEALAALPAGASVTDVSGKWIVPGFIDAHVHSESDRDLEEMLHWGVTSVRLMAEDVAAAEKIAERSRYPGSRFPEVFPAAPIFTVRGGWWGQDEPPDASLNRFPATETEARESVRKAKKLGSTEIKLMLDDMTWCRAPKPPVPKLAAPVAKALVAEAKKQGMRAIVHAVEGSDAKQAVAFGATALAHGVLDRLDAKTIAEMKRRPVFYVPTLDIFEFLADTRAFVDGVLSDPEVTMRGSGLPADRVRRYRSPEYVQNYRERYPNFAELQRRLPMLYGNLRRLREAGVPVALGTDMWAFPGLAVSIEMDLYVKAGIPPLEALRAATQTAARSLGIEKDRGTLEPGKRADLLVLDADPLADVKNVRKIRAIYKAGEATGRAAEAATP